jgi:hypothetical protein
MVAEQMWKHGLAPESLDDGTLRIEPQKNPMPTNLGVRPVEVVVELGNRAHLRVFVKTALELLGTRCPLEARGQALRAARGFARYNEGDINFKADGASAGSGLLARIGQKFRVGHSVEVWSCRHHLLARLVFFGQLVFTGSLTAKWDGGAVSLAHVLDPRNPSTYSTRFRRQNGPPLAVWHSDVSASTIERFEHHVGSFANERTAAAAKHPIERAPMPVLDDAFKDLVRVEFARLVEKRGEPKSRRRSKR